MENRTEVKTFKVSYICDNCGEGEMIDTGVVLTRNPMLYKHRCNKCFDVQNFPVNYPIIRYETVGSDTIGTIPSSLDKKFFDPTSIYDILYKS
jgi:hypothetical protein